ncbi:tetratricopeptide repeat protein [uncultured Enterovirga sp.]|uniref:tetratricopeptide repeat protein n=1 Tax=uncultured Enterovirga sp. TaxID=2026352 RepID=UPI0035CC03F2
MRPLSCGPRRAATVGAILLLAGCQSPLSPDATFPVAIETAVVASNELHRLGTQDLEAGNSGLAERHFREAVEQNGDDAASWIGLAAAYDNLGRFDLADRAYAQAIRLNGETLTILNNVGYSYLLRGDRARALSRFQHALGLYPGNPILLNNLKMVRTGERPNRGRLP